MPDNANVFCLFYCRKGGARFKQIESGIVDARKPAVKYAFKSADDLTHPYLAAQNMPEPKMNYFVHESTYIDEGVQIGPGTKIWHFCHIMPRARIGKNCNIGQNVLIASDVQIGDHVKIQNNVSVYRGVTLEDHVFLGPSMVFTNVTNPRSQINRRDEYQPTLVKRGATIGANATVLCGITLGEYAFVGAGAVVTHDVPAYALVYGNPARQHGWMCQCGEELTFMPASDANQEQANCAHCGQAYQKHDQIVTPR